MSLLRKVVRDGGPFGVEAALEDEDRRLVLASRANGRAHANRELDKRLRRALASGTLEQIVWNHTPVGETVALVAGRVVAAPVGRDGVEGSHSFRALVELSRRSPELVGDALEPLVR